MKYFFSLTCILLNFFHSHALGEECIIKAGASEYPPLTYNDRANNVVGMDVELMEIIGKQAGCTIQWLPVMNWENVINLLKSGEITIATSASDAPERREYTKMVPYRTDSIKVFVRNENLIRLTQMNSFDDFIRNSNYSIGIYTGYKYSTTFQKYHNDPNNKSRFMEVSDEDISLQFKNLIAHKVDSVIMETAVGMELIKRLGLENKIIPLGFDLVDKGQKSFSNIMVSKAADPKDYYYNLIQTSVSVVKNNQNYNDVINKYMSLKLK